MRIAHISDLHARRAVPGTSQITRRLSRRSHEMLQKAVDAIRSQEPDLIAVTGDLLDFPFYGFDDPWLKERAEDDLRLIADILDGLPCPKVVIGGNHDHPDAVEEVFGRLSKDFTIAGHRVLTFDDDEAVGNQPQRLDQQRRRFLEALDNPGPLPQIHKQHYVVWPELNEGYPHSYTEAASLRDAIVESGAVRLVLCGHYHTGMPPLVKGDVNFAIAPAFCDAPHPYIIYHITDDAITATEQTASDATDQRSPVVFLDRDGTVTKAPSFSTGPDELELIDGAAEAIAAMRSAGFATVLVSNQSCVGLGYVTEQTVAEVNDHMERLLSEITPNAEMDGVYCAYTHPRAALPKYRVDHDPERKPAPGLLIRAAQELNLDLDRAYMIGDRPTDLEVGRAAGAKSVLVRTGGGVEAESQICATDADFVADDLAQAVKWIIDDFNNQIVSPAI